MPRVLEQEPRVAARLACICKTTACGVWLGYSVINRPGESVNSTVHPPRPKKNATQGKTRKQLGTGTLTAYPVLSYPKSSTGPCVGSVGPGELNSELTAKTA